MTRWNPDHVGIKGTPTADGGMVLDIGRDPAGEMLVSISPFFMEKIGDLATAVESRYMGEYGRPKVQDPSVPRIQQVKEDMRLGMHELHNFHDNWPIMLVIRLIEEITSCRMFPQPHDLKNAANSLADAANKLIDELVKYLEGDR